MVPERQFEVIGGDAAETIMSEDESAEKQVVRKLISWPVEDAVEPPSHSRLLAILWTLGLQGSF